jgi:hypothetical protein
MEKAHRDSIADREVAIVDDVEAYTHVEVAAYRGLNDNCRKVAWISGRIGEIVGIVPHK